MSHKRRLFFGLILAVGCVIPNGVNAMQRVWPPFEESLFGNANENHRKNSLYLPLTSGLDVVAICLAEQIKAPEDRQRTLNCLGLLVSNALAKTSHLETTGLLRLSLRFLGSNLGETLSLCRAIKQRQVKKFFKTLSKRDIAAFSTKFVLATLPVTLILAEIIKTKIDPQSNTDYDSDDDYDNTDYDSDDLMDSRANKIIQLRSPRVTWETIDRWNHSLGTFSRLFCRDPHSGELIERIGLDTHRFYSAEPKDLKGFLELAGFETTDYKVVNNQLQRLVRMSKETPNIRYIAVSPIYGGFIYLDENGRMIL